MPSSTASIQRGLGDFIPLGSGVEGDQPMDVGVALGGTVIVTCLRDSSTLEFHRTLDGSRIGHVAVPAGPVDLDVTEDGASVLVACLDADAVVRVDVATRTVLSTTQVDPRPFQVEVMSDGVRAVVGCATTSSFGWLDVIDTQSASLIARGSTPTLFPVGTTLSPDSGIRLDRFPRFALSSDDSRVALPGFFDSSVWIYDASTANVVTSITGLPVSPTFAEIAADGSFAAFSSISRFGAPTRIVTVDLATGVRRDIANGIGGFFSDLVITPDGATILYGAAAGVQKVDVSSGQVVGSAPVGDAIAEIEMATDGVHALVSRAGFAVVEVATMNVVAEIQGDLYPRFAASPTQDVVAAVYPYRNEGLESHGTAGASSALRWSTPLGVPAEVDAPYAIELARDGRTAVLSNALSENLVLVDVVTGAQLGIVDLGGASHDFDVSAVSDVAFVGIDGTDEVATVDMVALQVVSRAQVPATPREVYVTPDGTRAIARMMELGDSWIDVYDLTGASATLATRGSYPGASWRTSSLSPDGATLALLAFDLVTLFDVASASIIATIPSTPFPRNPFWSADSSRLGFGMGNFETRVVDLGAGAPTWTTVNSSTQVREAVFDASGDRFYQLLSGSVLRAVDVQTGSELTRIAVPSGPAPVATYFPRWLERIEDQLLFIRNESDAVVVRVSMAGAASRILDSIPFEAEGTYDIAHAPERGLVLIPASTRGDGLRTISYAGGWSVECSPATPNSTGSPARIEVAGPLLAGGLPIELVATGTPPSTFGMFVVSRTADQVVPPGSQGTLCLGGSIARLLDSLGPTGPAGTLEHSVAPSEVPAPVGASRPGDVLRFQAWFRDANPMPTSNFTDAARVLLR